VSESEGIETGPLLPPMSVDTRHIESECSGKPVPVSAPTPTGAELSLPYRWRVWLAREQFIKAIVTLLVVLIAAGGAALLTSSLAVALAVFFALIGATRDFFFPLTYTLDHLGASVRGAGIDQAIPWDKVRTVYRDGSGLKLSPLARPSRLEAYRGVYLRWGSNREQVETLVRRLRECGGEANNG